MDFIAQPLGLTLLPAYAPTIAFSTLSFFGVQFLSSQLSPRLSSHYRALSPKTKRAWNVRVVSLANCAVLLPLVIRAFGARGGLMERGVWGKAFGVNEELARCSAVATGYFLWDTITEAYGGQLDFITHGLSTLSIFLFSFRPFVLYFVPVSLVYELSTPFLNMHWFLDKTNRTGTTLQLVNGITLLGTFFGARIVYGTYASYDLLSTVWAVRDDIPKWLAAVYLIGNPVLNVLNLFWFGKMITALRKRFDAKTE